MCKFFQIEFREDIDGEEFSTKAPQIYATANFIRVRNSYRITFRRCGRGMETINCVWSCVSGQAQSFLLGSST